MRPTILLALAVLAVPVASLAAPYQVPGLLPAEVVRPILDKDPAVGAARAGLEVAEHGATAIAGSPYEWTPKVVGQQRKLDNGMRYNEWSAGIERGIRLPRKAAADRRIGELGVEAARARYGEALHESALELMGRWVDWLGAEEALSLAQKSLASMQQSLDAVERRLRAGDASRMEQGAARAELTEQMRSHSEARANAQAAWVKLSARFAGVPRQVMALPAPALPDREFAFWRERVLAESDELKVLVAQERQSRARAERLRADRIPDPTISVFTASEFGGGERITGVGISIPLPGGARSSRASQAVAESEVSSQLVELKRREVEEKVSLSFATAHSAFEILALAKEGASAMTENARLAQRAYELGEGDLSTLLLARRQAVAAASIASQAQVSALKAYYSLLIHAHFIWGLDSD